jgi:hypothetical protein
MQAGLGAYNLHVRHAVHALPLRVGKILGSSLTRSIWPPPVNACPVRELSVASVMAVKRSKATGIEENIQRSDAASGPLKHLAEFAHAARIRGNGKRQWESQARCA